MNLRNYAYIGDAAWELFIREKNIYLTNNSKLLHKITTNLVKTSFQCEMLEYITEFLSKEEKDIAKRGRNLPIPIGRKNIQHEYRLATAFETLIGYWYIHNKERLSFIYKKIEESNKLSEC